MLTDIDQVAGMSEAAAALGRRDADRWLAQAVIDVVAAERAGKAAGPAGAPAGSQPPYTEPGGPAFARRPPPAGQVAVGLVTPTEPVPLGELGRVHFVGIGGAGMSGIARIMLARGTEVSGSDSAASAALEELAALGARVHTGHAAGQLGDADTVVVSSAIRDSNPELAEARRRGLRVLHRAAALASLMSGRRVIAVTGTHGKTTTTSMITTVLLETGAGPAYAIGGVLAATGAGAADGAGEYFVAEADESDGSFLMYAPDVAVVTNVEADHLDNYGTEQAYRESFRAFLGKVAPGGLLVTSADDPGTVELAGHARDLGLRVITYRHVTRGRLPRHERDRERHGDDVPGDRGHGTRGGVPHDGAPRRPRPAQRAERGRRVRRRGRARHRARAGGRRPGQLPGRRAAA